MKIVYALSLFICCALLGPDASAKVSQESTLSIEAAKLAVDGEYSKAIVLYTKLINLKPKKASHYIQRGLMYRQIKQTGKAMGDAAIALKLADYNLQQTASASRKAKLYWERAMAHRLLEQYDQAKQDIQQAMQLRGDQRWLADAQAIELESKMHSAKR